jgi:hypothetical protein
MHKSATKCNKTVGKWCKNKHGASKIIDTFETYHEAIIQEVSGDGSPYEVEVYYDGNGEMFSEVAGLVLLMIMTCISGGFCCSITTVEQQNLT